MRYTYVSKCQSFYMLFNNIYKWLTSDKPSLGTGQGVKYIIIVKFSIPFWEISYNIKTI